MTEVKDVLAQVINRLIETKELSQIEELSYIYGETPVYIALFLALSKRIKKDVIIQYTDIFGIIKSKALIIDTKFIDTFLESYLQLQVSKSGKGREGIIDSLKSAFKGMFLNQQESQLTEMGKQSKPKAKISDD